MSTCRLWPADAERRLPRGNPPAASVDRSRSRRHATPFQLTPILGRIRGEVLDMTDPDHSRWPGQDRVYGMGADAAAILGAHRPDERGMCAGCQTLWSLLVPFPCRPVEWAGAVSARVATLALLGLPDVLSVPPVDRTGHAA